MAAARVLVVDDEKHILELAARALGSAGYEVLQASTPRRALQIIGNPAGAVDLVISDVVMPEMRGPQLLSEIHRSSPSTAAVLMSGYAEPGELPAGVPFLRKPFSPHELVAIVERTLRQAATARQGLGEAHAEARKLRSDRRQMCEDIEQTTRNSKERTRSSREQFGRRRKSPPE